jgi:hypothetical protein
VILEVASSAAGTALVSAFAYRYQTPNRSAAMTFLTTGFDRWKPAGTDQAAARVAMVEDPADSDPSRPPPANW